MQSRTTLGQTIRARRLELGLTQEELAERIGVGVRQAEVSRLERDKIALPRPDRLRAIAEALGLEAGELLARSGWAGVGPVSSTPPAAFRPEEDGDASAGAPSNSTTP